MTENFDLDLLKAVKATLQRINWEHKVGKTHDSMDSAYNEMNITESYEEVIEDISKRIEKARNEHS